MRVYNFERALVIVSNFTGSSKPYTLTELSYDGMIKRVQDLENFDYDSLMDDLERDYGQVTGTEFFHNQGE